MRSSSITSRGLVVSRLCTLDHVVSTTSPGCGHISPGARRPQSEVEAAIARIEAAYKLHQQAFERFGSYPEYGWDRQALAAREDAQCAAVENERVLLGEALRALSLLEMRPPF